ncbi:DNA polymerase III subunit delta' [Shewanella cyperi]|uniref:DNA polymerase III subunit delta' n=1 Tax=Shewanella cyperi TaxID=2814292 RepID=UPI001A9476C6|nr:DNA polymerase III subunit delta' [Shewanella cyperi]QSX39366.1 DNA polymerase III subunit delta' [Shewanella cyperi]
MIQMPWLSAPLGSFMQLLMTGRLPHAILVGMDRGLGAEHLLGDIARAALCLAPTAKGACGYCKGCQLIAAGNHPDLYQVQADGHQIKIDQIRNLCQDLTSTSQQGGRRVAIIYEAERMNIAAANALLKTLEEPGRDTLLLLQSNQPARLLPTLVSRCQRLPCQEPSPDVVSAWLRGLSPEGEDVSWCLPVCGGPVKLAELLQDDGYKQLSQLRKDWRQSLSSGHLYASLISITEEQITDALKVLYIELKSDLERGWPQDAFQRNNIARLAAEIMHVCQGLTAMPNVNCQALCQKVVLDYQRIVSS